MTFQQDQLYIEIDVQRSRIFRVEGDASEEITGFRQKEMALLCALHEHNRKHEFDREPCSYQHLIDELWPERSAIDSGDLRALLARLVHDVRKRIEPDPRHPQILLNASRAGYVLHSQPVGASNISPFVPRRPTTHPKQFFGRRAQISTLLAYWKPSAMMSAVIAGTKRSGRTSLLNYLYRTRSESHRPTAAPGNFGELRSPSDSFRFVLINFQEPRMRERDYLIRHLARGLRMPSPETCTLDVFLDAVADHLSTPSVILMDRVEEVLSRDRLDLEFWDSMHALGSSLVDGRLGFVLTSEERPLWVRSDWGKSSPFFNLLNYVKLGPLTADEAREMVDSSPVPFPPMDIEWILARSKCWPAILQILCDTRLAALKRREVGDGWKEEGLSRMADHRHLIEAT